MLGHCMPSHLIVLPSLSLGFLDTLPSLPPVTLSNEEQTHKTLTAANTPCRIRLISGVIGEAGSVGCWDFGFRGFGLTSPPRAQVPATSIKPGLILPGRREGGGSWGEVLGA